jgi:hypothetical protein
MQHPTRKHYEHHATKQATADNNHGEIRPTTQRETMTNSSMEVELDSRQRLPLAKVIQGSQHRFRVDVQPGGELLLTPLVSISERELAMLKNPEAMASLKEGLDEAAEGKVVRYGPGHFSKEVAGHEAEGE